MKKLIILVAVCALFLPSCKRGGCCPWTPCNPCSGMDSFIHDVGCEFSSFMNDEFSNFLESRDVEKDPPVNKPAFRKNDVKKAVEYELMLKGLDEATFDLRIGHFEINERQLRVYAVLAENGLITLSTQSIKKGACDEYSTWADVALTAEGKKYISKNNIANETRDIRYSAYRDVLDPVRNRNAYGELAEEPNTDPAIDKLFRAFYDSLAVNECRAICKFGESEFVKTYKRVDELQSYLSILEVAPLLPAHCFTGGCASDVKNISIVRVTKYVDCYKVYFPNGKSAMYVVTPDKTKIFDYVLDEENENTLRTENVRWIQKYINDYGKLASKPCGIALSEEEAGVVKGWYAPGLVRAGECDRSRHVYPAEKRDEIRDIVKIVLYRTVVDKIYNVKIHSILEDNDNGIDYNYVAKADVVFKKVGITPFQYALQKKGAVPAIENLYELRNCVFRSYDDGVWGMR